MLIEENPRPISLEGTSKIKEQMKTCIFKIFVSNKEDKIKGSGFFCIIPFQNKNFITIIEIIPEKDNILNFLELDEKMVLKEDINYIQKVSRSLSIYLLYSGNKTLFVSYGLIKDINEAKIHHYCNCDESSEGGPIFKLSTQKVIGINVGHPSKFKINIGTLLKYPINEFINLHKDYIIVNE